MKYRYEISTKALEDLKRLFAFLEESDHQCALRAQQAIEKAFEFMQEFPWSCRRASGEDPTLRESVISFGRSGFVCLFRILNAELIHILAIRHQREEDYS